MNDGDKKLALLQTQAWGLWLWARRESPQLFDHLESELRKKGVGVESIDNANFLAAIVELLPVLQKRHDETMRHTADTETLSGTPPTDILASAEEVIRDKAGFRRALWQKYRKAIIDEWILRLKKHPGTKDLVNTPEKEAGLIQKAEGALLKTSTIENGKAQEILNAVINSQSVAPFSAALAESDRLFGVFQEKATSAPVGRVDVYAELLRQNIAALPGRPMDKVVERAVSQTQLLELFEAQSTDDVKNSPETQEAFSVYFQAIAETGTEKLLAPAIDRALSVLPVPTRASIVQAVTAILFEKTVGSSKQVELLLSASPVYQSAGGKILIDRLASLFGKPKESILLAVDALAAHPGAAARFFSRSTGGVMYIVRRAFPSLVFRWGTRSFAKAAGSAVVGAGVKKIVAGAISFVATPLGGLIAWVAMEIGQRFAGKAIRVGWDMAKIMAIAVVGLIVLLMVLTFFSMTVFESAFSTTYQGRGAETAPFYETTPTYAGVLPPAPSAVSLCPVSGGFTITQRPFEAGSITHSRSDAFDYAAPISAPVSAAHDGYLVARDGAHCLNHPEYGKYVKMVAKNADGKQLETIYAHLLACAGGLSGSPRVVAAGTIIGYVGSSGYSTGPHLHFEYRGPGRLTNLLPASCGGTK